MHVNIMAHAKFRWKEVHHDNHFKTYSNGGLKWRLSCGRNFKNFRASLTYEIVLVEMALHQSHPLLDFLDWLKNMSYNVHD